MHDRFATETQCRTRPWSDAGTWLGEGLRREVFYFPSRGVELYGSLYRAAETTLPFGLVVCGSWGVEADRSDPLVRSVALKTARLGGAAIVFHYPGYGDSFGDSAAVGLADLTQAAIDAGAEAERRCPGRSWTFAGFMFGAAIACLAQRRAAADRLLLVQPVLRPGSYFRWLSETSQLLAPGPNPKAMMEPGTTPGMAYGYPVPAAIVKRAEDADAAVTAALAGFDGEGTIIRHEAARGLDPGPMPTTFAEIDVAGVWRFGAQNHPQLARAAAEWLERSAREGSR